MNEKTDHLSCGITQQPMREQLQLQSPERLVKSQQLNLLSEMAAENTSHTHCFDAIEGFLASRDIVVDKLMWQFQLVQHSKITWLIRYCLETCCHFGALFVQIHGLRMEQ